MITRRHLLSGAAAVSFGAAGIPTWNSAEAQAAVLKLSDAAWRRRLTPLQFAVLRQAATEPAFSSTLDHETRRGLFACAGCGTPLFSSRQKYDSGTGWPSFWQILPGVMLERPDRSDGMSRTEVLCRRCEGHLGHVFDDGPRPTGLRYCMNGAALTFRPGQA